MSRLSNEELFNFMKNTAERAEECEKITERAGAQRSVFSKSLTAYDEALEQARKSALTKTIEAADKQRDDLYLGYKSVVKGFTKMVSGDMKDAADKLWLHIETYDIDVKDTMDNEAGDLYNLTGDLTTKYATEVATLGLTTTVEQLTAANDEVRALLKERDNEDATRVVGIVKTTRAKVESTYRTLIEKINALLIVEGDEGLETFVSEMNQQITRFKQRVISSKKSTTTTETTETDKTEE